MQEDHVRASYLRAMAVEYGRAFIGTPYKWGGDSPMEGFDCSGFVVEILQAFGILSPRCDKSAHDLYTLFKPSIVAVGYAGCLAFWLNDQGRATHVMLCISNEHALGAVGGGSTTISASDAIRDNAFIAIRPLTYRRTAPIIIDPWKEIPV